jgi:2-methylcitrate dehydratase PrpD
MSDDFDQSVARLIETIWPLDPLAPDGVEQRARRLLLDTLGCAIAGLATEPARGLAMKLGESEPGSLSYPGLPRGLSPAAFQMAFGAAACAFEGPEGLADAQGRPGLHVVPALLAHALAARSPLGDVLRALAIGYEVGGRIGRAYRILPGMHVDGTWGTLGATVGSAHLAGASPGQAQSALNVVACQLPVSLYLPITQGSVARNLYVGHGAVWAGFAVAAALSGTDGPSGALGEHMRILLGNTPEAMPVRAANEPWLLMRGYLKKYPVTKHVHYGIEAAVRWLRAGGVVSPSDRIVLAIYRNAMTYCGQRAPTASIQAQFSLSWGLAWALVHGGLTVDAFSPAGLGDWAVREMEARIEIVEEPVLTAQDRRGATLSITAPGSEARTVAVEGVPGDPDTPLSREELVDKFLSGAVPVIGSDKAQATASVILDGVLDKPLLL